MSKPKDIHDRAYHVLFSNPTIFRQLIETFVDEEWVKAVNFNECERVNKSFVSEAYKKRESDVIYKVKQHGRDAYIFVLIEFQSTVERFMALRVLHYVSSFYMDYIRPKKGIKFLPPIFPIVLYNGNQKWNAPVNIADLIEGGELLGKYALDFQYFKIAENEFGKEALLKIQNIISTLFLAEAHYDVELLTLELLELFDREEDRAAVSLFMNWLYQLSVHGRIDEEDYEKLYHVYQSKEEVKNMLIESFEKEREKVRLLERIQIAKKMLLEDEPIEKIEHYTELSKDEILKLKAELLGSSD